MPGTVVAEAEARTTIVVDPASAKKATADIERSLSGAMRSIGSGISQAGRGLTAGLTVPIVGASATMIKMASDFEREMIRVKIASGAPADEMAKLTDLARELGSSTVFSAKEAAEGMSALAKAGFDTDDIMKSISGTLSLAATEQIDLGRAAEITASAVRGMGLAAGDAGKVADALAVGANASLASVEGLGVALGYVAGTAHNSGLSLEQTVGALSAMSDAGIQASRSGTGLRQLLRGLTNPTKKLQTQLDRYNISVTNSDGSMRDFQEILKDVGNAGPAAMRNLSDAMTANAGEALIALGTRSVSATGDLGSLIKEIGTTEGAAQQMGDQLTGGTAGAMEQLSSAMEGLAISIANSGILQMFTDIVRGITDIVNQISQSNPEILKMAFIFGAIVAAIGPALVIIGSLVSAIGSIGAAIAGAGGLGAVAAIAGPILAVIAAVAALAIGLKAAYDNSKPFRDFINELGTALQAFGAGFVDGFLKAFEPLVPFLEQNVLPTLQQVGSTLERMFSDALPYIQQALPIIQLVGQVIGQTFGSTLVNIIAGVSQVFAGLASVLVNFGDFVIKLFTGDLPGSFDALAKAFGGLLQVLIGLVQIVFGGFIDAIKNLFQIASPSKVLLDIATDVMQGFINGINGMISAVIDVAVKIVTAITKTITDLVTKALQFGKDFVSRLANGVKGAITFVITAVSQLTGRILQGILDLIGKISPKGREIVEKLISGISSMLGRVGSAAGDIANKVLSAVTGLAGKFYTAGKDIVFGMIGGIQDFVGNLASTAASMAQSALQAAQGALDSHSPSRKFRQLGVDSVDGFALGFEDPNKRVPKAANSMATSALDGASGAQGAGGSTIQFNQNFYGPTTSGGRRREIEQTLRYGTKAFGFAQAGVAT